MHLLVECGPSPAPLLPVQVVDDAVRELCALLGLEAESDVQEYGLYLDMGSREGAMHRPDTSRHYQGLPLGLTGHIGPLNACSTSGELLPLPLCAHRGCSTDPSAPRLHP